MGRILLWRELKLYCYVQHMSGIFIQDRVDSVLGPGNRHLAAIRGNRRGHTTKIGQCIIVRPDQVPDFAFCHAFDIKIITVGKSSDQDGNLCGLFLVPMVMQIELLSDVAQLEIDAGITLDVKGKLFGISPFAVTPAVLAIFFLSTASMVLYFYHRCFRGSPLQVKAL